MKIRSDFIGLIGARGAKLGVGLATMFVYARIFGVSATYDAWIWSLGIINAAGLLLFGPITETIRASYATIDHREGNDAAEQYLVTVALLMIGTAIGFSFLSWIMISDSSAFLPFAPRGSGREYISLFFLRALLPSIAISQMVSILTAYLNCNGTIYRPEIAGIIGSAVSIILIIAMPQFPATWLLLGSYYIGLMTPLFVGLSFWPKFLNTLLKLDLSSFQRHSKEALAFSFPLFLPYGLGQLSGLVERQFALQAGTGALSILSYAFFARNTVQAVFTAALSALAVPLLAKAWDQTARDAFRLASAYWTNQCFALATMGMIILFGLSDLLPVILFGAKIAIAPQHLLGSLLRYYAIAIISVVAYLIGGAVLLAARKGRTYAVVGAGASIASILLLLLLFPFMGIAAIPVAVAISHAAAAWLMFHSINRSDGMRVLGGVVVRAAAVISVGWFIHSIDMFLIFKSLSPLQRLPICGAVAGCACGLWWIIEHYIAKSFSAPPGQ